MARALMVEPELVMLDEPMAGVNPALTQSLLDHIKDLRDEGMTVLFVEHDMDMVRDISDWVIVMAEGRIIAEGPPDAIMREPARDRRLPGRPPRRRPRRRGRRRGRASSSSAEADDAGADGRARATSASASRPRRHGAGDADDRRTTAMTASAHLDGRRGRCPRADDLVAGYMPGVNILNGCDLVRATRASWSASSAPTAPASRRCSRRCSAWSGPHRHGHAARRGHHRPQANELVAQGVGFVPADQQRLPER